MSVVLFTLSYLIIGLILAIGLTVIIGLRPGVWGLTTHKYYLVRHHILWITTLLWPLIGLFVIIRHFLLAVKSFGEFTTDKILDILDNKK